MSDLLKLKFIADWNCCSRYECYRIQVDKVDDYLLGAVISVVNEKDKNQEYTIKIGSLGIELKSFYDYPYDVDIDGETRLVDIPYNRFSYLDADDLEEVLNALKMLKPEMEKYRNILHEKKLKEDKRKELWLEKEPFEFIL
nr:MAG TPA: hypothetical protein [Caudoviricetes sp.]